MTFFVSTCSIINVIENFFFKRPRIHVWRIKIVIKKLYVTEESVTV